MELRFRENTSSLPTSNYELMDGDLVLGKLQLRHKPSKSVTFPEGFENHIYYEIVSEERGRGYGTELLRRGLEEARRLGLKEVVLTCVEDNVPSQKIIEANGGQLLDMQSSVDGEMVRKYKIEL